MNKILTILIVSFLFCVSGYSQFINRTTSGSANTNQVPLGGTQPDSMLAVPSKIWADTTSANFSKTSFYQGALIMTGTSGNATLWFRNLNPNVWTKLAVGTVPSIFNPIAGYGMVLTGAYPNITFTVDTTSAFIATWALLKKKVDSLGAIIGTKGSGTVTSITQGYGITNTPNPISTSGTVKSDTSVIVSKPYFNNIAVKYWDTTSMLTNYLTTPGYGMLKSGKIFLVDTNLVAPYTDTLKSNGIATKSYVQSVTPTQSNYITNQVNSNLTSQVAKYRINDTAWANIIKADTKIIIPQTGILWSDASAIKGSLYSFLNDTVVTLRGQNFWGVTSTLDNPSVYSTFFGYGALQQFPTGTAGYANSVFGYLAGGNLKSNSVGQASSNSFFGHRAGNGATTMTGATLLGTGAGDAMTTGYAPTAVGWHALNQATGGGYHTAVGTASLYQSQGNQPEAAFGFESLYGLTTGIENTGIGGYTFRNRSTGSRGVAVGTYSGYFSNGERVVLIGNRAENNGNGRDVINIGAFTVNSMPGASNEINIGNVILGNGVSVDSVANTAAQIGIGVNRASGINSSAILQLDNTNKGFLQTRMSEAQRAAISSPATGLQTFTTGTNKMKYYDGTIWRTLLDSASANNGTVTSVATNSGSGITGGTITTSGTLAIDTANVVSTKLNVLNQLNKYTGTSNLITAGTLGVTSLTSAGNITGTTANFSGDVSVNTTGTSANFTIGNNTVLGANTGIRFRTGANQYGWVLGAQYNVNNTFEITPSTTIGGNSFTTPVFQIGQSGNAIISGTLTAGANTYSSGGYDGLVRNATSGAFEKIAMASGTYTPTITVVGASATSTTAYQCQYMRVGNTVTVSGKFAVTPVNAGQTFAITLSLPISSNFTAVENCGGGGITPSNVTTNSALSINADATNDVAYIQGFTGGTTSQSGYFSFTYLVQ